jgi:hypothetical protein
MRMVCFLNDGKKFATLFDTQQNRLDGIFSSSFINGYFYDLSLIFYLLLLLFNRFYFSNKISNFEKETK